MTKKDEIKEGNKRLLKLADFLDKLPKSKFNYEVFIDGNTWKGKPDLSCGTQACAMGWAASLPTFKRLGAGITVDKYSSTNGRLFPRATWKGQGIDWYELGAKLFYITLEESEGLFTPGYDVPGIDGLCMVGGGATPKQVANKIRAFAYMREATT